MIATPYTGMIPGMISSLFKMSDFPIPGLSQAVRNALRLFVPSPQYCFSDTAGTTPAVQDGNVALWKEATGKALSASQATAGFQPKLRKGAKNWILNSTMQGAVAGSPGTAPTGFNYGAPSGVARNIVGLGTVELDGKLVEYVEVRFNGTAVASGEAFIDPVMPNVIQVALGQVWTYSTYLALTAGTLPTSFINVVERNASTGFITSTNTSTNTMNAAYQRYSVTRTLNQPTVALVSCGPRFSITSGQSYDFTIRIAAPQLELGVSTPSAYAPTSGAPASNGVGNWWLDFDGVQTRLDMSAVPIAGGAQGFVSAGVAVKTQTATTGYIYGQGSISSTAPIWASLYYSTGNSFINSAVRNDANFGQFPSSSSIANGVYTAQIDSLLKVRYNSVQGQTAVLPSAPITINTACIGALSRNGGRDSFYPGGLGVVALGQVDAVSPSELQRIESFISTRLPS